MAKRDTPETVAASRIVSASAVLDDRIDLRGYPHRHLAVDVYSGFGERTLTGAMTVADTLEPLGWELLNVSEFTSSNFGNFKRTYAFFRRR